VENKWATTGEKICCSILLCIDITKTSKVFTIPLHFFPEGKDDQSLLPSAEIENAYSFTFVIPFIFMVYHNRKLEYVQTLNTLPFHFIICY